MANVRHLHYICGMIELSRHIETLLLENDCVILPGFGGFITHYAPAAWDSQEYTFRPPTRIVGFNPQLKINDGLLAQSYMAAHDTSFGKAMQMLEKEIEELRQTLHEDGAADLRNVGRLRCSMHQVYDFTPCADGMTAPELYGLGSFKMLPLAELEVLERQEAAAARALRPAKPVRRTAIRRRMAYIANVAATIVAVVLFFALSTPIENTEVMKGNYAQMFPETFFEQIESQSLAITPINARNAETRPANVQAEACRPVDTQAARSAEPATTTSPAPVQATPADNMPEQTQATVPEAKPYHIIVASVGSQANARIAVEQYVEKGYQEAKILTKNGKVRIGIASFATEREAYLALPDFRQEKGFENAWVLKQ